MAYLLDTHVFFWVIRDSPLLPARYRQLLISTDEPVFVSAASGWEIATKVRLGKWPEASPLLPGLAHAVDQAGLAHLPLSISQAERAGAFTMVHKDPFDRFLAAQALDQDLTMLTVDSAMQRFGCRLA